MQRFATPFGVAYDSLVGKTAETGASGEDGKDAAAETEAKAASAEANTEAVSAKKKEVKLLDLASFRAQCEAHCKQELEARVVALVREGTGVEIAASVTKTRLYKNLTDQVTLMGFYDCKNAKLCTVFEGEGAGLSLYPGRTYRFGGSIRPCGIAQKIQLDWVECSTRFNSTELNVPEHSTDSS